MDFYIIDKRYVNELKQIDSRVGNVEYGIDKLKFHLGVIIKVNNKDYYVPVSSPKNKHSKMSDSVDFIKINHYASGELLCVLNLNNMIPVPVKYAYKLENKNVEKYRLFSSEKQKNDYIFLLDEERLSIRCKENKIQRNASKLYQIQSDYPDSKISKRCCNFKELEKICSKWE